MIYHCCKPERRDVLAQQSPPVLNGIDFLEVIDNPSDPNTVRQRTLRVHFIHDLQLGQLQIGNIQLTGGERIPSSEIGIDQVVEEGDQSPPGDPKVLLVEVTKPGDFSTYTLQLIDPSQPSNLPPGVDPILSSIEFSFKVACHSDFDCAPQSVCAPAPASAPDISYLAKDYASFRQLMFDRMAKILPQWTERNAADFGTVLVEMIAYVADYLSYQQDAVATEAYLDTARRRPSVRRHARLVGYPMHEGCNARTWIQFKVRDDVHGLTLSSGPANRFLTRVNAARILANPSNELQEALTQGPRVFELMSAVTLFPEHNQMSLYAWGDRQCCLPRGATRAWLRGSFPNLKPEDVLIFAEVKGPDTGAPEDADPQHRWAVRLTDLRLTTDPIGGLFAPIPNNQPVAVTEIEWAAHDALPFPFCISSLSGTQYFDEVSVVLGNVAVADDGCTIDGGENLPAVPPPNPALTLVGPGSGDPCNRQPPQPRAARYRPTLKRSPITFADPSGPTAGGYPQPAADVIGNRLLDKLLPVIYLTESNTSSTWRPQRDLLASHADSLEFVVETENDGTARLRFGDGVFGMHPDPGTQLTAFYRVGNGVPGNIGRDSLRHFATDDPAIGIDPTIIVDFSNPLPGAGGLDPETLEQVRYRAPQAFRIQERAVTAQDYGDRAVDCDASIARAVATFRWTGSWQTVFITSDREGGVPVDAPFRANLASCMERYRMAGHDVEIDAPQYVPLEIAMDVCVKQDYFASHVQEALLQVLSNRDLPNGQRGVFHPDNFTFGQTIYVSPLYASVQKTDGVDSVRIRTFRRRGDDTDAGLDAGMLELGRLEIARLDNDPNFPEHGSLTLNMLGGR